jgi:tripartite-type tricarboxylate transporter receptor subunit TctC
MNVKKNLEERMRRISSRLLLSMLACLAFGSAAVAQDNYPSKLIRVIVPYSAGGASDISARQVAAKLEKALGQSVVVENMPTAAGVVAFAAAAKAPPDGYTLLYTPASIVITKAIRKDARHDALTDFVPISLMLEMQSIMTVRPGLPVNSIKELVDLAKKQKGQLTYASLGNGSEPHLMMEMFKKAAGVDIQMVPFKITPTIYTELLADRIDMMLALMPSALPQIRGGKLRGLGVSGPKRSPALPDTPTIREAGVPNFAQTFWAGLSAPKGTPADVIAKVHAAVQKAIEDPEVKAWALTAGAEMRGSTSAEFGAYMREQTELWNKLVSDLGLKAN